MKNFCITLVSSFIGVILCCIFWDITVAICAGVVIFIIGIYSSVTSVKKFPLPLDSLVFMARLLGKMIGDDIEKRKEGVSCITMLWTKLKKYEFEEEITIDFERELAIGAQMSEEDIKRTITEFANTIPDTKEADKFINNMIHVFVIHAFNEDKVVPWKLRLLTSICVKLNKSNELTESVENYIELCNE